MDTQYIYLIGITNYGKEQVHDRTFFMELRLICYQLEIGSITNYKMYYESLMVTTKQNRMIDTQMIKRKESEHTTTKIINSKERKKGTKASQNDHKAMNKMSIVGLYQ